MQGIVMRPGWHAQNEVMGVASGATEINRE